MVMATTRLDRGIDHIDTAAGWLDSVLQVLMALVLAAIFTLMISQVLLRYVLFMPIIWIEEAAAFLLPLLAIWGSAVALRHGMHLKVDFILLALPDKVRLAIMIAINVLIVYFAVKITQAGLVLADLGRNELTTSQTFYLYWPRMTIAIGGVLIGLQGVVLIMKDTARLLGSYRNNSA